MLWVFFFIESVATTPLHYLSKRYFRTWSFRHCKWLNAFSTSFQGCQQLSHRHRDKKLCLSPKVMMAAWFKAQAEQLCLCWIRPCKDVISLGTPKPKKEFPTKQNMDNLGNYHFRSSWLYQEHRNFCKEYDVILNNENTCVFFKIRELTSFAGKEQKKILWITLQKPWDMRAEDS